MQYPYIFVWLGGRDISLSETPKILLLSILAIIGLSIVNHLFKGVKK